MVKSTSSIASWKSGRAADATEAPVVRGRAADATEAAVPYSGLGSSQYCLPNTSCAGSQSRKAECRATSNWGQSVFQACTSSVLTNRASNFINKNQSQIIPISPDGGFPS